MFHHILVFIRDIFYFSPYLNRNEELTVLVVIIIVIITKKKQQPQNYIRSKRTKEDLDYLFTVGEINREDDRASFSVWTGKQNNNNFLFASNYFEQYF